MQDISVRFDTATPAWPGDTPWSCTWAWEMMKGASVNVSRIASSPHVGTHADAPLHVRQDGIGADRLPLVPFLGRALVIDVSELSGVISLAALRGAGYTDGTVRLLLRTGRTIASGAFPESWPSLDPLAVRTLTNDGLKLFAVDCPSVDDRESKMLAVHHAIFDGGAFVLENLDLRAVTPGHFDLLALPMPVGALDAAPVRALLRAP